MVEPGTGVGLHVLDWGQPTADAVSFVLVHGLASNARLWDAVARELTVLGHGAVAVDLRGHGRSDKPDPDPGAYATHAVADELAMLCAELARTGVIAPRPVVVGQSWGGNVVVELAHRHPDAIRGVCAVDGGTIELADVFPDWEACARALAPPMLAGTPADRLRVAIASAHPDWSKEAVEATMHNMELRPDGTVRPWLDFDRHMAVLRGLWEHAPSRLFEQIRVPVLLAPAGSGHDDPWDKRRLVARAERTIATCRAEWFEGADHDLHAQHPVRLARLLDAEVRGGIFDVPSDSHRRDR
jgi:pimeloyl-ACP methyl ester carboxylesterase